MRTDRISQWRPAVIIAAVVEYACIAGLGIWGGWYHSTGASGDMPFELLLIPLSLLVIAMGYGCFWLVSAQCLRANDSREAAVTWGAMAAMLAPLLSSAVAMCCNFPPLPLVSGFILAPLLVLGFRKRVTSRLSDQR